MKVAVYGSCQAPVFGICLKTLLPDSEVRSYQGNDPYPDIEDADLIFAEPFPQLLKLFDSDPRLRLFPHITFTGFHPDCTYILKDGKVIHSPAGDYSSSLVAACFLRNMPENDVPSWFIFSAFEAIGFIEEFNRSKTFLLDNARSVGFDLSALFESWCSRQMSFMHTINHPAVYVIDDLCRAALSKAGIVELADAVLPNDPLLPFGTWPVYSALAEHLGVEERPLFNFRKTLLTLSEFIAGSYKILDGLPRELIAQTPSVGRVLKAMQQAGI